MSSSEYNSPWGERGDRKTHKERAGSGKSSGRLGRLMAFGVFLLVILSGIFFYFLFFQKPQSSVSLEFSKPGQVLVGEPFSMGVSFSNLSDGVLKNVRLSLFLPDGVYFMGQPQGQRVSEQEVGDIGPGSINQQTFKLIITGASGSLKRVQAKLTYSSQNNSSGNFESSADADILVGDQAVALSMSLPQNVFNGDEFETKIDYANNSRQSFQDLHLKMDYPPTFQFRNSTMKPDDTGGNNSWDLGTLEAGGKGSITIKGVLIGPEKSFFGFNGSLSAVISGNTYAISAQQANLVIASAPLSLTIGVNNGGADYISRTGDVLRYTLSYKNNSNVVMQGVFINAKLTGDMFDFSSLQTNGSFNSLTNTATWIAADTPSLANVAPGQGGYVELSVNLKKYFPIRLISDKNYTLKVVGSIESATVPPGTAANKTSSVAGLENKVTGQLDIASEAYWRDAQSGILNSGPYPPKVNQTTQYTIHWRIKNYSTDVNNVVVSGSLRSGAKPTGKIKSNIDSVPSYNPGSGLITWNVGSILATKGVISSPVEAVFQIEATPAVNQVGDNMDLVSETKIQGVDSFTGSQLQNSAPVLDTNLPYDKTILSADRRIQK